MLIDRLDAQTASRVAAGLVTPISGMRAAASWRWNELYPAADLFYGRVERESHCKFWHVEPALRAFQNEYERVLFEKKWIDTNPAEDSTSIHASSNSGKGTSGLKVPFGIYSMEPAARLDTNAFLSATQRFFEKRESFHNINLNCNRDIVADSTGIGYPIKISSLELAAKRIVFCQGMAARENRFFRQFTIASSPRRYAHSCESWCALRSSTPPQCMGSSNG